MPKIIYEGLRKRIIWGEESSGKRRGEEFYNDLDAKDLAKVDSLFQRMGDQGEIRNKEKFRLEEDGIYCFKSFQIRFACFFSGNDVIVTHGFRKKDDKLSKTELDRANRIRSEHRKRS